MHSYCYLYFPGRRTHVSLSWVLPQACFLGHPTARLPAGDACTIVDLDGERAGGYLVPAGRFAWR